MWTPEVLVKHSELPAHVNTLCLAALVARGLVQNSTGFGGLTVCRITALGLDVLIVLREYSEATGDSPRG